MPRWYTRATNSLAPFVKVSSPQIFRFDNILILLEQTVILSVCFQVVWYGSRMALSWPELSETALLVGDN